MMLRIDRVVEASDTSIIMKTDANECSRLIFESPMVETQGSFNLA